MEEIQSWGLIFWKMWLLELYYIVSLEIDDVDSTVFCVQGKNFVLVSHEHLLEIVIVRSLPQNFSDGVDMHDALFLECFVTSKHHKGVVDRRKYREYYSSFFG